MRYPQSLTITISIKKIKESFLNIVSRDFNFQDVSMDDI